MAHCKENDLQDLLSVLEEVRALDKIKEKGFAKFYLKSKGFLHFHTDGEQRWADVRDGDNWGSQIALPFTASRPQKVAFIKKVKNRYLRCLNC